MTKRALLLALALLAVAGAPARAAGPSPGAAGLGDRLDPGLGNGGYDALHYDLDLRYATSAPSQPIDGTVTIAARATQALSQFDLDFAGRSVGDVTVDGKPARWRRDGEELVITPRRWLRDGETFLVRARWIEREWLDRYEGRSASTADFIALASHVSHRDLSGFLRAWLYGTETPPMPGHPDWTVNPVAEQAPSARTLAPSQQRRRR